MCIAGGYVGIYLWFLVDEDKDGDHDPGVIMSGYYLNDHLFQSLVRLIRFTLREILSGWLFFDCRSN